MTTRKGIGPATGAATKKLGENWSVKGKRKKEGVERRLTAKRKRKEVGERKRVRMKV